MAATALIGWGKRGAATAVVLACLAAPAGAHEADRCQFARMTWDMQDHLSALSDANWRLSDVVTMEALPLPEQLSSGFSSYREKVDALGELIAEYLRCAEHVGLH